MCIRDSHPALDAHIGSATRADAGQYGREIARSESDQRIIRIETGDDDLADFAVSHRIARSRTVSYTHLDVYKRQHVVRTARVIDHQARLANLRMPRNNRGDLRGMNEDTLDPVSYTHLDVYKRQEWINTDDSISVLILTGAGKAFSAGGNVKHMLNREGSFGGSVYEVQKKYREGIQRVALALHKLEVPSIAAVNGPAIGAGFDLACMCDLRIASSDAKMGETFVNLGIIPGDGGAWLLQRVVGYQLSLIHI